MQARSDAPRAGADAGAREADADAGAQDDEGAEELRARVRENAAVKAMLEVFPAEITRIEKIS
ncbi:MAG: hypothetical protein F4Y45_11450 [Acidobacteria bacterium]|nr:hypothetical protein [Acidobacteriota bacterium]